MDFSSDLSPFLLKTWTTPFFYKSMDHASNKKNPLPPWNCFHFCTTVVPCARVSCTWKYCRVPGKWGLQQKHLRPAWRRTPMYCRHFRLIWWRHLEQIAILAFVCLCISLKYPTRILAIPLYFLDDFLDTSRKCIGMQRLMLQFVQGGATVWA